jgi:hypothetical protein
MLMQIIRVNQHIFGDIYDQIIEELSTMNVTGA